MHQRIVTGSGVPSLCFLAVLSFGIPADAQPPSREDASRILGPKGGTILVYELDRSKVPGLPAPRAVDVLVNVLNDRFGPNSLYDITIRKADKDRLQFILAVKGKQPVAKETLAEELKRIKYRVSKVGSLELSILANSVDDQAAIEDLRKLINSDGPEITKALKEAQANGQPPPVGLTGAAKVYDIAMTKEAKSRVNYRWVELSERELRALNLDPAAKDDPKRDETWKAAAKVRGQAAMLPITGQPDRHLLQGALFYSRECKDENLPTEVRLKKPVDFFVLARNPEIVDGKPTARIDGRYLRNALQTVIDGRPTLTFQMNDEGAELLGNLTRKNVSAAEVRRHLAIILDGAVMSAPTVNSEIRNNGQISGVFTVQEVDEMVSILRAGTLPVTLRPRPVAEITIEPASK